MAVKFARLAHDLQFTRITFKPGASQRGDERRSREHSQAKAFKRLTIASTICPGGALAGDGEEPKADSRFGREQHIKIDADLAGQSEPTPLKQGCVRIGRGPAILFSLTFG